ncbi:hypothetical protein BKA70DRAFT_398154 [Coprinopsis sp. MPI-PUGE-AT-0042]|nr:hypothetical protein BKA70DRAFT_398154 [Coprinopsis sp. MPI-PUGE-AT-0042]
MSPAVVQHRHSGRALFNSASPRTAPYCKRSSPTTTTGTPPPLVSSSSSSPIPPLLPLSWTKLQTIISWRNEVSAATSSSSSCSHSNVTPIEMEQEVLDYWDDCDDGIERYTFVPEGGGERRLFELPHPEMNPLMTSEQALIEEEYVRVITHWNGYEEEKWKAEKAYRRMPTSDNLAQFMKTANAVKVAGDAARYVELHATRWRVPTNFDALFCKHYRPPSFFLYLADPDDWNPPPWFYDDCMAAQEQSRAVCMESFYAQHPVPPPLFTSQQPPISLQVPKWTIPPVQHMQLAV